MLLNGILKGGVLKDHPVCFSVHWLVHSSIQQISECSYIFLLVFLSPDTGNNPSTQYLKPELLRAALFSTVAASHVLLFKLTFIKMK